MDLTPYLRHLPTCEKFRCTTCGQVEAELDIHYVGTVDSHPFVPKPCSCGLYAAVQAPMTEIRQYLSPTNQNAVNGDLIACIRDLAQIAVSAKGNYADLQERIRALIATMTGQRCGWLRDRIRELLP